MEDAASCEIVWCYWASLFAEGLETEQLSAYLYIRWSVYNRENQFNMLYIGFARLCLSQKTTGDASCMSAKDTSKHFCCGCYLGNDV